MPVTFLPVLLVLSLAGGAKAEPRLSQRLLPQHADTVIHPAHRGHVLDASTDSGAAPTGKLNWVVMPEKRLVVSFKLKPEAEPVRATPAAINLYFGINSADFDVAGLRSAIESLANSPGRILVTGHADSTGPHALNARLSRERAEAVARALRTLGLDGGRITIVAKGATEPAAPNAIAAGREKNRRVTIEVAP